MGTGVEIVAGDGNREWDGGGGEQEEQTYSSGNVLFSQDKNLRFTFDIRHNYNDQIVRVQLFLGKSMS